jgi:hypothetical protein
VIGAHCMCTAALSFVQVTTSTGFSASFLSPANVGDNGLWKANETESLDDGFEDVKLMQICLPGSGSVAFLHFQVCLN